MRYRRYLSPKLLVLLPLVIILIAAIACGADDATATPQPTATPVDIGAIASGVQEAVKETVGQALGQVLTAADVQQIVSDAAGEALSAEDVQKIVAETAGEALSAEDVQNIVAQAVEASAGEALTAGDVQKIVAKAVATPTPMPTAAPSFEWMAPAFVKNGKHGGIIPMQAINLRLNTDPHQASGALDASLSSGFWSQLMRWNFELELVGDLVRKWEITPEGSFIFSLYEGVTFSDGESLNADDVKFSLDRMVEEGRPRPNVGKVSPYYDSSEVIDERTIKVNVKIPGSPAFLEWLTVENLKIIGKHVGDAHPDPEELESFLSKTENINGSGPFLYKDFQEGVSFETERNPDYWKGDLPFIDGYKAFIITERTRLVAAYKAEQVLMPLFVTGLSVRDALTMTDELRGQVTVHWIGAASLDSLIINWEKPPYDDARLRRALYIGVDRLEWLNVNNAGRGFLGTPFPNPSWMTPAHDVVGTWPGFRYVDKHTGEPILVPYDNDDAVKDPLDILKAKALLAEAGFDEDNPFKVVHNSFNIPYHSDASLILREQLKRIGVKMEIKLLDVATNFKATREGDYAMTGLSRDTDIQDSDSFLQNFYMPGGVPFWTTIDIPRISEIFTLSSREFDPDKRQVLIREAGNILRQGENSQLGIAWTIRQPMPVNNMVQHYRPGRILQENFMRDDIWLSEPERFTK